MARNVLIIEDDPATQFLLRTMVDTDGWTCRFGDSYADATRNAYWADAVLLDLNLAGAASGPGMIPGLRGKNDDLRIVVVTGDDTARERVLVAGADAFVTKPFEVCDVLDALNNRPDPLCLPEVPELIDLRTPARALLQAAVARRKADRTPAGAWFAS